MNRVIFLFILSIGMFFVSLQTSRASHIVASDLTYKCLRGGNYQFTLHLYRDCIGIELYDSEQISLISASNNFDKALTLIKYAPVIEVSAICGEQLKNTECNGGTLMGIQQHVYTGNNRLVHIINSNEYLCEL